MEIALKLRFVFVRHCNVFLLHQNYFVCLFNAVMIFDHARITLYFGTFELLTDITL